MLLKKYCLLEDLVTVARKIVCINYDKSNMENRAKQIAEEAVTIFRNRHEAPGRIALSELHMSKYSILHNNACVAKGESNNYIQLFGHKPTGGI